MRISDWSSDVCSSDLNFYNAIDAVFDGAGNIVCRIHQTSVTDPSCVPINILGEGRRSQAALNYINTTSYRHGKATELDLSANLFGDSSQWFELPGGPVRFAICAESLRDTASYAYDDLETGRESCREKEGR